MGHQPRRPTVWAPKDPQELLAEVERLCNFSVLDGPEDKIFRMEQWCLQAADDCLALQGLVVDDQSRRTLARAIAAAIQRAGLTLAKLAKGEFVSNSLFSPMGLVSAPPISLPPQRAVSFQDLLDGWSAERRPVAKTVYEWSRVIRELEKYLGHSDAHPLRPSTWLKGSANFAEPFLRHRIKR